MKPNKKDDPVSVAMSEARSQIVEQVKILRAMGFPDDIIAAAYRKYFEHRSPELH